MPVANSTTNGLVNKLNSMFVNGINAWQGGDVTLEGVKSSYFTAFVSATLYNGQCALDYITKNGATVKKHAIVSDGASLTYELDSSGLLKIKSTYNMHVRFILLTTL